MFSGAFAAIVLLDTITPKEAGAVAEAQEVRISYSTSAGATCVQDGNSLVFSFRDGGEIITTSQRNFGARLESNNCVVSGFVEVYLAEVDEPCVLVVELLGTEPKEFDVSMTGNPGFSQRVPPCK